MSDYFLNIRMNIQILIQRINAIPKFRGSLPRLDGKCVLKSSNGLGGGCVGGKLIVGPYRQSNSDGLKGNEIPGGRRDSIPVIPPAADTGGSCGSCIVGKSFITRSSALPGFCK